MRKCYFDTILVETMSLWEEILYEAGKTVWTLLSKTFSGFFSELIGVSIGAYLGYHYGMRQEREMRVKDTNEQRVQCLKMILHEIEEHQKTVFSSDPEIVVKKREAEGYTGFDVRTLTFFTSSFDSAISSGLFSLLDPEFGQR